VESTTTAESSAIERTVRIAANPETVFDCWVDPTLLVRWMGTSVDIDPRPGGIFRIDYNGRDVVRGEFVEVDRPRRLVVTWGWEAPGDSTPPGASRVEITLEPDGDGTVLTLRHVGLVPDAIQGHAEGWDYFLPRLDEAATQAA
jgi:uncharacterized protein YndB with AHSA1/START domain